MDEHTNEIAAPLAKFISLWAMVGVTSWGDFAALMAALWSMLLCIEWFYVKIYRGFLRPALVERGYLKPSPDISSRVTDDDIQP